MNETCTHNAYGAIIVVSLRNIHNKNVILHLTITKDFLRAIFAVSSEKNKKGYYEKGYSWFSSEEIVKTKIDGHVSL